MSGIERRYCETDGCKRILRNGRYDSCWRCRAKQKVVDGHCWGDCRTCGCKLRKRPQSGECAVCSRKPVAKHENEPRCGECTILIFRDEVAAARIGVTFRAQVNSTADGVLCVGCAGADKVFDERSWGQSSINGRTRYRVSAGY